MKLPLFTTAAAAILISACQAGPPIGTNAALEAAAQPAPQANLAETSQQDFQTTVDQLRAALEARPLTIFRIVDHAAGAREAGLELQPSTLFIFGNPKSGTPLMQANPALGIELPMKMLVIETGQGVQIIRSDVSATLGQYGVAPSDVNAEKIEETLAAISTEAAR